VVERWFVTLDATAQPTPDQIDAYRRDGFVVLDRFLDDAELSSARDAFTRCFAHEWRTGIAPDEVNYQPGVTPSDKTRQLCNLWKADRLIARVTLAERTGHFAALLAGEPGMRLFIDNAVWKPANGTALLAHQDAGYQPCFVPENMTTCWVALDDTHADTGTIYYARGSNHWPHAPIGGQFHAPDDWVGYMRSVTEPHAFAAVDWCPIEVPAGGAAFHDGWTWHGSPPNMRGDRERRAIISHMITTRTTWHPSATHPLYSRYRRPGERELDEAFFPILWREDGYRTPLIDEVFAASPDAVTGRA
jgi:ectoine hydroxylase-related dioxygenase (phytanoyl-CoA dioxygenase family)